METERLWEETRWGSADAEAEEEEEDGFRLRSCCELEDELDMVEESGEEDEGKASVFWLQLVRAYEMRGDSHISEPLLS